MLKACCLLRIWDKNNLANPSDIYSLTEGRVPLLVSFPHSGEKLGPIGCCATAAAKRLADTDWHLPRLYDFLGGMGASVLAANYSRYVIDLNRDPSGESLYPGQNVTELCPTTTFAEEPIYKPGHAPDAAKQAARVETYWRPYHDALALELDRLVATHGYALLWDAHSIASQVPRFFEGTLPDFNLGTNDGQSCGQGLGEVLLRALDGVKGYSAVLNGRFKGGFITRRYGNPAGGVHAVQLELSQATYMDEAYPFDYHTDKAEQVAGVISSLLQAFCTQMRIN
jgi:N-formylglutamate deformylase